MHLTFEDLSKFYDALLKEYEELQARNAKLLEAVEFILSKENIMFAECTDAEEILLKCKQALEADQKAGRMNKNDGIRKGRVTNDHI